MTGPAAQPVQAGWTISPDDEIDLTKFAEIVDTSLEDGYPMLVASANGDEPDIAFKGSLMVWDKDHFAFWERGLRDTYAAIGTNPKVALVVRNLRRDRRNVRFWGVARIVDDPELRERVWVQTVQREKDTDPEKKGVAVLVRVDRLRSGVVTLTRTRAGTAG